MPALLQWGGDTLIRSLTAVLRACLAYRYVPKQWREVKVIFIPKPGKTDYTDAKSFRPISLTSFLLKTLERLCDRKLREGALSKVPMHENQHAYSQGKSTESALHAVVDRVEGAIKDKSMCLGTFIDIEGAFDKTKFASIRAALLRHGVNAVLTGWIGNMLTKRAVRLASGDPQRAIVAKGCPQGGVLSPLLWNMVVNDLITTLNANHYYTIGYADDLTILISGRFAGTVFEVTQAALRIVEQWCDNYELSVNPTKTGLVLFTNRRSLDDYRLPTLFGTELKLSNETKYLGVLLDSKLNWNRHLEQKLSKASITFWQCKAMIGKKWGLTPKTILWLYTSVVRPMVTYGAVVWWPRTKLSTAQGKLQSFQRLACMAITGSMTTTPTAAIEAMLDIPPLHLYIKQEAAIAATRLKHLKLWKQTGTPHAEILDVAVKEVPLLGAINDRIPKQFVFDKKYKIELYEDPWGGNNHRELSVFTDGSKTESGTGSGAFSEDLNIRNATAPGAHKTVFQAECVGITMAASAIEARKVRNYSIRILSDSRAVLMALKSDTINSGLIYDCHHALSRLCVHNSITLQWIKGHSESRGNDAADELARRGSDTVMMGPEPKVPLPFGWLRSTLRQRTKAQHSLCWNGQKNCRQAKEALPSINPGLSRKLLQMSKPHLRLVTGALTGHTPFNKHMYTLGITDSPLCRGCMDEEETAAHVLLECTSVANFRTKHLGTPRSLPEVTSNLKGLVGFLEEIGWQT